MTQDDRDGGIAPTHTAMDITPKPGAADGGAGGVGAPPAAVPEPEPAAAREPTRTAMDITPDREA
ncbi:MAG: hypothetical protein ACRYGC_04100 [Janthinobacterium lividum]